MSVTDGSDWHAESPGVAEVPTVASRAPMRWPRIFARRPDFCADRTGRICRFLRCRERNNIAALFSLLGVILVSAALADNEWFTLSGGNCQLNHIGANFFYSWGHFRYEFRRSATDPVTPDWSDQLKSVSSGGFQHVTYLVGDDRVVDCVTPDAVDLLHGVMGSCILALIANLAALYVDLIGVKNSFLRWVRRNAIFSVVSVVFSVIVVGLSYWATLLLGQLLHATTSSPENVRVEFADGFYLVVCSALMGVCAVAANLLRASLYFKRRTEDRLALIENFPDANGAGAAPSGNPSLTDVYNLFPGIFRPPPPAYSP